MRNEDKERVMAFMLDEGLLDQLLREAEAEKTFIDGQMTSSGLVASYVREILRYDDKLGIEIIAPRYKIIVNLLTRCNRLKEDKGKGMQLDDLDFEYIKKVFNDANQNIIHHKIYMYFLFSNSLDKDVDYDKKTVAEIEDEFMTKFLKACVATNAEDFQAASCQSAVNCPLCGPKGRETFIQEAVLFLVNDGMLQDLVDRYESNKDMRALSMIYLLSEGLKKVQEEGINPKPELTDKKRKEVFEQYEKDKGNTNALRSLLPYLLESVGMVPHNTDISLIPKPLLVYESNPLRLDIRDIYTDTWETLSHYEHEYQTYVNNKSNKSVNIDEKANYFSTNEIFVNDAKELLGTGLLEDIAKHKPHLASMIASNLLPLLTEDKYNDYRIQLNAIIRKYDLKETDATRMVNDIYTTSGFATFDDIFSEKGLKTLENELDKFQRRHDAVTENTAIEELQAIETKLEAFTLFLDYALGYTKTARSYRERIIFPDLVNLYSKVKTIQKDFDLKEGKRLIDLDVKKLREKGMELNKGKNEVK